MSNKPFKTTRRVQNLQRPGWYRIKNQVAGLTRIDIFDEIGMLAVSADAFIRDLASVNGDIELHLNSPGGEVWDGLAIYNNLRQHQGTITVVIDGLAASAASFIAQAASPGRLFMAPHSQMMIHDALGMGIGNASDMRELAGLLDKASDNIAGIYADRSGKPAAYWREQMQAETWYSDQEAVDAGLADGIQGKEASADWDLSVFAKWPGKLTDAAPKYDPDHDGDDDSTAEGDTDHDYVKPDGTKVQNADKYKQDDRDRMAKSGEAMPDGSYPIADAEDLDNAIHAVGRGNADHDSIRRHIIKRAKALGLSERIPDNWNADGSIESSSPSNELADFSLLASLFTSMNNLSPKEGN